MLQLFLNLEIPQGSMTQKSAMFAVEENVQNLLKELDAWARYDFGSHSFTAEINLPFSSV